MEQPFRFFVVTDTHYFENDLGASGEAYEKGARPIKNALQKRAQLLMRGFPNC